jgi:hypothetical protein
LGAWFNRFRRLRVRDERRADSHAAFVALATALILLNCVAPVLECTLRREVSSYGLFLQHF